MIAYSTMAVMSPIWKFPALMRPPARKYTTTMNAFMPKYDRPSRFANSRFALMDVSA